MKACGDAPLLEKLARSRIILILTLEDADQLRARFWCPKIEAVKRACFWCPKNEAVERWSRLALIESKLLERRR